MKRKIYLVLLSAIMVILLCACNSNKQYASQPSASDADTSAPVSASAPTASETPSETPSESPSAAPSETPSPSPSQTSSAAPSVKPSPQESAKDPVLKAYSDVLLNKLEFLSTDDNKLTYLKDFSYWNEDYSDSPLTAKRFAIVDMDGDKNPEVVLELTNGADGSFEVLHYYDDIVYGFNFVYRGMENLKADGTYIASGGAADNWYNKLQFNENTYTEQELAHSESDWTNETSSISYFIDGKQVTEGEFSTFSDAQNKKKDAAWYDFTTQNIEKLFK